MNPTIALLTPPAGAVATGETPEHLATACLRYLEDPPAAAAAGAIARQYIQDSMSGDVLVQKQLERFRELPTAEDRS